MAVVSHVPFRVVAADLQTDDRTDECHPVVRFHWSPTGTCPSASRSLAHCGHLHLRLVQCRCHVHAGVGRGKPLERGDELYPPLNLRAQRIYSQRVGSRPARVARLKDPKGFLKPFGSCAPSPRSGIQRSCRPATAADGMTAPRPPASPSRPASTVATSPWDVNASVAGFKRFDVDVRADGGVQRSVVSRTTAQSTSHAAQSGHSDTFRVTVTRKRNAGNMSTAQTGVVAFKT